MLRTVVLGGLTISAKSQGAEVESTARRRILSRMEELGKDSKSGSSCSEGDSSQEDLQCVGHRASWATHAAEHPGRRC